MTFWSLTNSDFPTNQTFHQFHDIDTELDLHRLWVVSMEHLQRVWHASGERFLPDTWFRSLLWDLLVLQLLRPDSSNLPCLYSTFHLEYPLVLSWFCLRFAELNLSLTFYLIAPDFHTSFVTGSVCQQRTLFPPDPFSCLTLGPVCVLMLRQIAPEFVLFPDFWVLTSPGASFFYLSLFIFI